MTGLTLHDLERYDAPHSSMTIKELALEASAYHKKAIETVKWTVIYCINSGLRLMTIREKLGPRKFKPWLDKPNNFDGRRTTAYKFIALAESKDEILSVHQSEQIDSVSDALTLIGKYTQPTNPPSSDTPPSMTYTYDPERALATREAAREGVRKFASEQPRTDAEQAIVDRLLKPGDTLDSGLGGESLPQYLCYLCRNPFYAESLKAVGGNNFCLNCRGTAIEEAAAQEAETTAPEEEWQGELYGGATETVSSPPTTPTRKGKPTEKMSTKTDLARAHKQIAVLKDENQALRVSRVQHDTTEARLILLGRQFQGRNEWPGRRSEFWTCFNRHFDISI